jgi:hypothetical protein
MEDLQSAKWLVMQKIEFRQNIFFLRVNYFCRRCAEPQPIHVCSLLLKLMGLLEMQTIVGIPKLPFALVNWL